MINKLPLFSSMIGLLVALCGTIHGMEMPLSQDAVTVALADGESTLLSSTFTDLKNLSALSEIIFINDGKVSLPALTKEGLDALMVNMSTIKAGPESIEKLLEHHSEANKYRELRALISAANYLAIESVMSTYFAFLDKKIAFLEKLKDGESIKILFYRLLHPLGLLFSHEKQLKRIWFYLVKEPGSSLLLERFITQHRTDVDYRNDMGQTALKIAIDNDRQDVVKLLLEHRAAVNAPCGKFDCLPVLLSATLSGVLKGSGMVTLLLENGAVPDVTGDSELIHAARNGCTAIVELLLDHGALTDRRDQNGYTALIRAAQHGHEDIVRLLLHRNAPVNTSTHFGETALTFACEEGHAKNAVLLLDHGAQTEIQDTIKHNTPLMEIMERTEAEVIQGHPAVVTALLTHGAIIGHVNKQGHTVVSLAARYGRTNLLRLLFSTISTTDAEDIRNRVIPLLLCINRLKIVNNNGWEVVFPEREEHDRTDLWDMLRRIVTSILETLPNPQPDQPVQQFREQIITHIITMLVDERMQRIDELLNLKTNNQTPLEIAQANNRHEVATLLGNREAIRKDIERALIQILFTRK